ncbi:XkdX family protein [Clostridium rectalis]|nr:XkdX family protein [Clostridium rectalis]
MFNFYNTFYKVGYLDLKTLREATRWGCITEEQFKTITGEDFVTK